VKNCYKIQEPSKEATIPCNPWFYKCEKNQEALSISETPPDLF